MRLARFAFQACAIDRSAISPLNKINNLRLIVGSDVIPIVIHPLISGDHLRARPSLWTAVQYICAGSPRDVHVGIAGRRRRRKSARDLNCENIVG
jgi:hypothetical protein